MDRRTALVTLSALGTGLLTRRWPPQTPVVSASPNGLGAVTGVNVRPGEIDARTLDLATGAGFGWIRTDVRWNQIEAVPGTFDFGPLTQRLTQAARHGLKVIGILDYGHPTYTDMLGPQSPDQRHAFARFANRAVSALGPWISAWEVWNEPNHPRFWPPKPDANAYTALLTEVTRAIWSQDPKAIIVTGGLSTIDADFLAVLNPVVDHLARGGRMAIGLHPYRVTPPETVLDDLSRVGLLTQDGTAATPNGVPVWFTEWGYCRGTRGIGLDKQTAWAPRIPLVGAALGVPVTILFELRDGGPLSIASNTCGLFSRDDEPYPVYGSWKNLLAAAQSVGNGLRAPADSTQQAWAIGSCDAALVWNDVQTPGATGEADCGQPNPGVAGSCVVGVRRLAPAKDFWAKRGKVCR